MTTKTDVYNEDELLPPLWLDNKFFLNILIKSEKNAEKVKVKNFKITPATIKGDHYASAMFRASVEYSIDNVQDKFKSMIIKTMPEVEGVKKQMFENYGIFEVEIGMYTEVLPYFEKYLHKIGDETKLMAPILYHSLTPHKIIVFEDLVPLGYNVIRNRAINEEEVTAAYAKLAKWHAISHVIINENPHFFDKYRHSFLSQDNVREKPFIGESVKIFMNMMRKTSELQKFLPKFEKLVENVDLLDEAVASITEYRRAPHNDAYYVLNHGDYHLKNIMFKHNTATGRLEDVMLVDFQFSHVGPLTNDLIYSIFMLLDNNLRKSKKELLQNYFEVFQTTLKKIDSTSSLPNYMKFQEQFIRHKYLEIFLMITFMPIWTKFCRGEISVDLMVTDEEYRKKIYEDKEFINELLVILPKYIEEGYLDI